ncbi:MAG TPA: hypothetical protein VLM40_12685, partial [Gemmata sp.]|nr:hypothetical protein [Gemmata sp.]
MRVTCPGCHAPFIVANELAEQPSQCPNCGMKIIPAEHPRLETGAAGKDAEGRSRALTVAALLHLFYVTMGGCIAAGVADAVQEVAPDSVRGMMTVGFVVGTVLVAAVSGVGLLARRLFAGYTALILSGWHVLIGLQCGATGYIGSGLIWIAIGAFIGAVVWVR